MLMFEYSADRVDGGGALAGVTGAGYRTLHHNPAPLPHKEEMGGKENGKKKQPSVARDQIIC